MSEENTTYKSETTASEATKSLVQDFARYTIRETFPHKVDGLKLVHRRILDVLGTTEEKQKMNNLVGGVMQRYHPHGDNSIVDSIVRMCQSFNQVQPLVYTGGNFGDYGGGEAAAGRYLDVHSSKFARDLFFSRVNTATFSRMPTETGKGTEPSYFVPILPTALLTGCQGLGVGFSTFIPHMNLMNVCDAVDKYLKLRKEFPMNYKVWYKELAQYFIPDFPTYSLLRNTNQLLEEYRKGNFDVSVIMDGTIDIHPDNLSLRTVPYQTTLSKVYQTLGEMTTTDTPVSKFVAEVADLSKGTETGHIDLSLKRSADPFKALPIIKKIANFTSSLKPIWNFSDTNGILYNLNPVQLIDIWYIERHRSILGDLKVTSTKLLKTCRILEARIIVADHVDAVVDIFKKAETREETIPVLVKRFNLTQFQAAFLSTLQMHQITKKGRNDLVIELQETKAKLKALQERIVDIDAIIMEDVNYMRREYSNISTRRTAFPDFIGVIKVGNDGYIQFSSIQEMNHLVRIWGNKLDEIIMYPTGSVKKVYCAGSSVTDESKLDLPKEFVADKFVVMKNKPAYSIVIRSKNIFRLDRLTYSTQEKIKIFPVGQSFISVKNDGTVEQMNSTSLASRRDLQSAGAQTDIQVIFPTTGDDLVAIYCNDKNPNIVYFERIKPGQKIRKPYGGKTQIMNILRANDPYAIVLQPPFLARCTQKIFYVKELNQVFTPGITRVEVFLYRKNTSNGKRLVPLMKQSEIWTLSNKQENENVSQN